ncbi:MAG: IS66 family transposase [Acidobacteria bacterium]|nr:IS66 family transposase [Acidobacteriota bacterium]
MAPDSYSRRRHTHITYSHKVLVSRNKLSYNCSLLIVSATLSTPVLSDAEQVVQLKRELHWAHLKIQVLEERLRLDRIKKYGPGGEKLSDAQLKLLDLEPGVSQAEVQAESEREPLPAAAAPKKHRPHPGRQELPAGLPRVDRVIPCAPEQCTCRACGKPTEIIGYDESEQLDVEPAKYFVVVTKREKRACKSCAEGGVAAAAAPARIVDKGLVSDRVVIDTVVAKYSDHLPLYRQSAILARETGIDISRATMDGWVMRVGELLTPVAAVMRRDLVGGSYIQADETTVDVQMHDGRGQNHQAYLWQYGRPGGGAVFEFRLGRGREGPREFLGQFEGILQTDGYVAYDQVGGPKMVHAACWAHARRKFYEAGKLNPGDTVATGIVKRIDELFRVDAQARAQDLDHAGRHALRLEQAGPLLDLLKPQIETAGAAALPSSALGKAAYYTLTLWRKLTRFLEYPEIELSNNLAENSMRPIALGRKNWIHLGSPKAGPKVAAILSIVESCRRMKIPVRDYMAAVLPGLADISIQRLADLTPAAWAARNR